MTSAEVRDVVDQLRHMALDETLGPTAIVVASEVAFGMLRMLEILIEEVTIIRPFRDYDEAVRWLEGSGRRDDGGRRARAPLRGPISGDDPARRVCGPARGCRAWR